MNRLRLCIFALPLLVLACSSVDGGKTIAGLQSVKIDISEAPIEGGLEKAMAGYQRFLQETPDTPMAPEAIRRLADLKVEKEYGYISGDRSPTVESAKMTAPESAPQPDPGAAEPPSVPEAGESEADFERRTTLSRSLPEATEPGSDAAPAVDDLDRAGAREAIELYQKLLRDYPLYERNDQVLYQLSRAYEELGRIEAAMDVMDRLVREYPRSRYLDEVQFRRAEFFFSHRQLIGAEEAYASIVALGVGSSYFPLALYKLGWTYYKQELYEEALHKFIALLDYQLSVGYDFDQTEDEQERKRLDDTFRVISLGFSYLGGADAVVNYFADQGVRSYEDSIYSNLGEYFFGKRRYSDAVATYNAFVSRNPFHRKAPQFHMRVIDINIAGGFPSLVIEAKKAFATDYGLNAEYWQHYQPADRPEVLAYLKTNLTDLANHYHALYRDKRFREQQPEHYREAQHWYREFLASFPQQVESPVINYQLADLLMENRAFAAAAVEYEKTAYTYPAHERSATAGYAAVYAYRQHLETAHPAEDDPIRREVVRSSLQFAEAFPQHEKAAVVLGAAADDLYGLQDFEQALAAARKLIETFPGANPDVQRSAWLVAGHSSYELQRFSEAEAAYVKVLELLPEEDQTRTALIDNLAAAIYKQGEQANARQDYRAAAEHFLRVGVLAPTSKIRSNAEFDAATALIRLKDWPQAARVLLGFRESFPEHELQPEVTKKLAYVYREDGRFAPAAAEYERIETESQDDEIRRDALLTAADLYQQAKLTERVLDVYRRYVDSFPQPVELNLETRNKLAELLKAADDRKNYLQELRTIVAIDAQAGAERTARTRYLAAQAAMVLAEPSFDRFVAIKLVSPLEQTLPRKQAAMKASIKAFTQLLDYEVGDVTAAATFYLAEIYAHFSKALMASERPELTFDDYTVQPGDNLSKIAKRSKCDISRIVNANNLNKSNFILAGKKLKIPRGLYPEELEQYELALEEQSYPFEEKAISVHESNLKLISQGVYNTWIDKSLQKLAKFVPARYDKPEEESGVLVSVETYSFEIVRLEPPVPAAEAEAAAAAAATTEQSADTGQGAAGNQLEQEPAAAEAPPPSEQNASGHGNASPVAETSNQ
jgi:tetratricopeptide (TPR) repeat protein